MYVFTLHICLFVPEKEKLTAYNIQKQDHIRDKTKGAESEVVSGT